MPVYIASEVMKLKAKGHLLNHGGKVLVRLTFKAHFPDTHNSKVVEVVRELDSYGTTMTIYNPDAEFDDVRHEYKSDQDRIVSRKDHAMLLAVGHKEFYSINPASMKEPNGIVLEAKGLF